MDSIIFGWPLRVARASASPAAAEPSRHRPQHQRHKTKDPGRRHTLAGHLGRLLRLLLGRIRRRLVAVQASGSPANNPRAPSEGEIVALYNAVWSGNR